MNMPVKVAVRIDSAFAQWNTRHIAVRLKTRSTCTDAAFMAVFLRPG